MNFKPIKLRSQPGAIICTGVKLFQPPTWEIIIIRGFTSGKFYIMLTVNLSLGGIGVHTFGENVGGLRVI